MEKIAKNLTDVFKELNKTQSDSDVVDMLIPDELLEKENTRVIKIL